MKATITAIRYHFLRPQSSPYSMTMFKLNLSRHQHSATITPVMSQALGAVLITAALLLSSIAHAAKPIYSGGRERAAIRGYDPVAYFTQNKPVKGSAEFTFEHKGATWMFSSAQNLELFKSNPDQYSPQYGGYCAYAIAKNTTASIKPEFFTIHDGKLYLNFSKSVHKRWLADKNNFINKANANWPKVLDK